jgi:hypothetical protein
MTVKLQGFYRLIEERAAEFAIFMAGFVPEATSRAVPFAAPDAGPNYRYTALRPMRLRPAEKPNQEHQGESLPRPAGTGKLRQVEPIADQAASIFRKRLFELDP